jgi:hypothetical protein
MADTTRKLFDKQTQGTSNWHTPLNTNFDEIDKSVAGVTSSAVTAADVTLTDDEARSPIHLCTGTLTGNRSLIFPARQAWYWVSNGCDGAFTLTAKVSGQTGVIIPPGQFMRVYCNATDIVRGEHAPNSAADINQRYSDGGGTSDAITAVYYPAPAAWVDGAEYYVQATAANSTTTPTFTPNSGTVTAKTIVKGANTALAAGDIIGDGHILHLKYLSGIDKVVLLNPAAPIVAVPNATTSVRGLVEISTAAEFQNDTADRGLTGEVVWDAAATVALTDAATVTVDFSTGINFTLLINGNRTLGSPSNEKVGQSGFIKITKTSAGQTLAYGSEWKFAGGTDPVLSTSASDTDVLHYQVIASGFIAASLGKAYA